MTVVAAEDVDLPFVHDEIGGIASGGLAHPGAHSAELNLVSGGFALERGLAVGSGEEVDELAPRDAEGRLAWDFLAPDEKHWIEPVEGVDCLDGFALRSTGRAGGQEYDECGEGEHVHIVAFLASVRCGYSRRSTRAYGSLLSIVKRSGCVMVLAHRGTGAIEGREVGPRRRGENEDARAVPRRLRRLARALRGSQAF